MVRNQGRATDKQPIYTWDSQIGAGVRRIDRAAVQNRDVLDRFFTIQRRKLVLDNIYTVGNVVRRGEAGALCARNRPDRLVGNDDLLQVLRTDLGEAAEELVPYDVLGLPKGLFGLGFADAENRGDAIANRGGNLVSNVFIGLSEDIAALRMANDGVICHPFKSGDAGLAGIGAEILIIKILGGEL